MKGKLKPRTKFPLIAILTLFAGFLLGWSSGQRATAGRGQAIPLPENGILEGDQPVLVSLPPVSASTAQTVLISLESLERLNERDRLSVAISHGQEQVLGKYLHSADPDFFVVLRNPGGMVLEIGAGGEAALPFRVEVQNVPHSDSGVALLETEPNNTPDDAVPIQLGRTVFASADDRPFIRAPGQDEKEAKSAGVDWYKFEVTGSQPQLVFMFLELLDREVPVDVALFTIQNGGPVSHLEGFERFEPEHSTSFIGLYKFLARRLDPGTYYLRVRGNHPSYQLKTEVYPVPPFDPAREGGLENAARKAIRVGMDYIVLKGDSWHANTPRVGGIDDRIHNVHAETAQCIACHPTHFSTRGELLAIAAGYPVRQRPALKFLTERLYNNPRPFYGHPEAAWARMISASANVLSRLSMMLSLYEQNVSLRPRASVHQDVAEYLKLYYEGRNELPPDESNGNRPLVSAFEVATHSWMVFDELYRHTKDPEYARWRDQVRDLIVSAAPEKIEDMLDLCYQTIALCRINREAYREQIERNVEKIFSHQRSDGQWPMGFGEEDPSAEFQTGHALYTLVLAGIPKDDPRVEKAIRYLLARQHPFGGWYDDDDPNQPHPYENFSTPFRETQFSLMAFSRYFPGDSGPAKGWDAGFGPMPARLDESDEPHLLKQMNEIWETPSPGAMGQLISALTHQNVLVRQQAAASLGRVGGESAVAPLVKALDDRSKLVRRASAWALRELGNQGIGKDAVAALMESNDLSVRRAVLQVFAQHHRYWIDRKDIRQMLLKRMQDSDYLVRLLSARALWQWWYWEAEENGKSAIEDAYLSRMAVEEHPWVQINLKEGFYSVCDENTRYLYNNWIALLGTEESRRRATQGHHESSRRQASKIAAVLSSGPEHQRRLLLEALGDFHLRSGVYDRAGRYDRIGNDVETIQFYPQGAEWLKPAVARLLADPDPVVRQNALLAGYTLRGTGSEDVLGVPYLQALGDENAGIREVAQEFHRDFLPKVNAENEPAVLKTLLSLIDHDSADVRSAALGLLPELELSASARGTLSAAVKPLLVKPGPQPIAPTLRAVVALPPLWRDPLVLRRIASELTSTDQENREAALHTVLRVDVLNSLGLMRRRLDQLFAEADQKTLEALLRMAVRDSLLAQNARMVMVVMDALQGGDPDLRRLALDLVRRNEELQANAGVRAALSALLNDPNQRIRQIAESVYTGEQIGYQTDVSKLLDYEFFKERVQPVFVSTGGDGKACVDCHHNHGILKLTAPDDHLSSEEVGRANYRSALKVINLEEPEKSLILRKPLSTGATEGVVDAATLSHGGDIRWPEKDRSWQYQAILAWLNGARLEDSQPEEDARTPQ